MPRRKTTAQIRRLQKRAEARGETYIPPVEDAEPQEEGEKNVSDNNSVSTKKKQKAAAKLQKDLIAIEKDEDLKAKDRRSAKRKAEAIAMEASGCSSVAELLEWYEANGSSSSSTTDSPKKETKKTTTPAPTPYILFIGQLSYTTTKQQLMDHLHQQLKKTDPDHHFSHAMTIRLLTDETTKKSRGMAFVQVECVETLFTLLHLHQTVLDGRRINVERTAGSGKRKKAQQLQTLATARQKAMEETVQAVWQDYQLDKDALDEGVKALCARHAGVVVRAAVELYVETNGHERDNPSAYLTALVGKLATEGIYDKKEKEANKFNKKQRKY